MTRMIFSLLTLALAGFAMGNPLQETLVPVHTLEGWEWSNCGEPTDAIQIKSIVVSPDPPKPGQELTVKVIGSAQEKVDDGAYVDVTVKLGLVKLLHKEFDVCEEARNANATVQCPIEKGDYDVTQSVELPKEIPHAKFTVAVRGYTVEDENMVCINLSVDFRRKPFFKAIGW